MLQEVRAGHEAKSFAPGLRARGPDHFGAVQVQVPVAPSGPIDSSSSSNSSSSSSAGVDSNTACCLSLHMAASLLQLRGSNPSTSPLTDSQGNILCFNGEIFAGLDIHAGANDGKALLAALQHASAAASDAGLSAGGSACAAADASTPACAGACERTTPTQAANSPGDSSSSRSSSNAGAGGVMGVLSRLRGPWSLLYWQEQQQTLWFGRDVFGKRSLLMQMDDQQDQPSRLVLTSVTPQQQRQQQGDSLADGQAASGVAEPQQAQQQQQQPHQQLGTWVEVPPGVYSISAQALHKLLRVVDTTISNSNSNHCAESRSRSGIEHHAADCDASASSVRVSPAHTDTTRILCRLGREESANLGVDSLSELCAVLPGLQHHQWLDAQLLQLHRYERRPEGAASAAAPCAASVQRQQQQPHDANGVDQSTSALQQLQLQCQQQPQQGPQQLTEQKCLQQQQQDAPCHQGQSDSVLQAASEQLLHVMQAAVNVRCLTISTLQQQDKHQQSHSAAADTSAAAAALAAAAAVATLPPAPVLILFSGGVDSTLIAALAHRALPPRVPIDLSNVCFDAGRSADRAAARAAVLELAAYASDRAWRLIEVDSSLEEVDQLAQHIRGLLKPASTVMDWNIGSALWLAARAKGRVWVPVYYGGQQQQQQQHDTEPAASGPAGAAAEQGWRLELAAVGDGRAAGSSSDIGVGVQQPQDQQQQVAAGLYKSAARVVLLGHGADEQCGGYGRHRTKFRVDGLQGVADELALDVKRLWLRNLGRDDRLIADHGREGRHPFLDEDVMLFLQQQPLQVMVDFSKPPGVGDKRILRHLLASLGLPQAAGREKRAIQFGSKIGQLSNKRDYGSNRQANKRQAGSLKMVTTDS